MTNAELYSIVFSAIAIIFAALIAAVLGFYGNFVIKQLELDAQIKKEKAQKKLRYYLPLLRFTYTLDRRIGHILTKLDSDWLSKTHLEKIHSNEGFALDPDVKGYFIISSIYIVASFFGWTEAIKKGVDATEPTFERSEFHRVASNIKGSFFRFLKFPEKKNVFLFDPDISKVSKMFQYRELFDDYLISKTIVDPLDANRLHKQFQYSIGELMLEDDGENNLRTKSFREFLNEYLSDESFRYWFVPLENLFIDLSEFPKGKDLETQVQMKNDIRPLRLIAIRYWCRILMQNMSHRIGIKTKSPEDALEGISEELRNIIRSVKLEDLESYLLGENIYG